MAITTLTCDADGTTTGWTALGAGVFADEIQDIAGTDDDTSYIASPNVASGSIWLQLTSVPANFDPASINSITIRVLHRRLNTPVMAVDKGDITAFLTREDEATAVSTTPTAVDSVISASYGQTDFTPTATGTHTVAQWNAARLQINFVHTQAQNADTVNIMRVTAAEVEVDYTPLSAADQEIAGAFFGPDQVRGRQLINIAGMTPPSSNV